MDSAVADGTGNPAQTGFGPPRGTRTLRPGGGASPTVGAMPQPKGDRAVKHKHKGNSTRLGDFTTTTRVIPISLLAIVIGLLATGVAWALLRLIGFFTNLFYFGKVSTALTSPAGNHLGWFAILVPVGGALIIGLMARYGSERIRGHGIPEAIESILINGSKVEPKVAILKPLSSAISIGSGGPFGAEGPIIMTGGAFGSMIAQFFHLTAAERKTLLVAGAAAGMSATFATPRRRGPARGRVAAVRMEAAQRDSRGPGQRGSRRGAAVHSRPRSAVSGAAACRSSSARQGLIGCVLAGLLAGALRRRCSPRRLRRRGRVSTSCPFTGCGGRRSAAWSSASAE